MLQLGQHSLAHDIWLSLPSGTCHNQASPWGSPRTLSHWRECNELHFISGLTPQSLQLITGTADFIRHYPPMSAMGGRQHPQQGPLLSSSGGGGEGDNGSGAPVRPTTGLLWPRGCEASVVRSWERANQNRNVAEGSSSGLQRNPL